MGHQFSIPVSIVYYHGNDWEGVPARQRYLMTALADKASIIYLDGSRDGRGRVSKYSPERNVTVIRGLAAMLFALDRRRLGVAAKAFATLALRQALRGHDRVIVWDAENALRPYRFIRHDLMVFDCIDPAFSTSATEIQLHLARERQVLENADVVFASATLLQEQCQAHHRAVHLINNACEPSEYAQDLVEQSARPAWWPRGAGPVVGYLGSLDWRVDYGAIHGACRQHPSANFVLAGSVHPHFAGEVRSLSALPNVICPGRISVEDGRHLLAHCDIGLIPFTPGSMNDAVNPVKMYAYALLGKPIAAIDIRELRERPEVAVVAAAGEPLGGAVARALQLAHEPLYVEALRAFAVSNTWKHRADTAWDILDEALRRLPSRRAVASS